LNLKLAGHSARIAAFVAILATVGACVPICGIGAKFAVTAARVDSSYNCPYPSENRGYDVQASIDTSNTLNNTVTIKSITETDQLVKTAGSWDGPKTAKGGGPVKEYSPTSVPSGADATIKFAIPFQCSNSGPNVTTYGEFAFKFTLVTSAGAYTIDSGNRHRLNFPSS
jgi:hypothetical protein